MSITKWLEAQRAAEAAMTKGPFKSPYLDVMVDGGPIVVAIDDPALDMNLTFDTEIQPSHEDNSYPRAYASQAMKDAAGIVAMRNSWSRVLDVVEAAETLAEWVERSSGNASKAMDLRSAIAALSRLGSEGT